MRTYVTRLAFALLLGCSPAVTLAAQAQPGQSAPSSPIGSGALRAAASDKTTRAFYRENGWHAVWGPSAAQALAQVLDGAAAHGLDRVAFLKENASIGVSDTIGGETTWR